MADWGQKAKDKDRDDAIRVINDAAARGQIVDVDKLKRIQEVQAAGTVGEIDLITRGLAAVAGAGAGVVPPAASPPPVSAPAPPANPTFQQYTPPVTPPVTEPDPTPTINLPPTNVQYGEPLTSSGGTPVTTPPMITKGGGGAKWVLIIVLIVIAGVTVPIFFGIKAIVDTASDTIDDFTPNNADTFSDEGFKDLLSDLEDQTGSTQIFDATLYPGYAYVQVPAESTGKRMYRYHWDGDLEQQGQGSVSDGTRRMDLSDVRLDVLEDLRAEARDVVEDAQADTNYVIVHAPGASDEGASLFAYATNDFSEGGYVSADLDGKVIRTTTW